MTKPLILVSSDDGYDSPGLIAAVSAAADLGEILIAVTPLSLDLTSRTSLAELRQILADGNSAAA